MTAWEHKADLIVPKLLARNALEACSGYVSPAETFHRLKDVIVNRLHNIAELMEFDRAHGVPSTFFVAVSRGRSLNYSIENAAFWVKSILGKGFDVGLHGIALSDHAKVVGERDRFSELSGLQSFGIRIHNIGRAAKRRSINVTVEDLSLLEKADYTFSSNTFVMEDPFRVGRLWEFPIHIMDGYVMHKGARRQNKGLEEVKRETIRIMDEAYDRDIKYFNVLFHDMYFSRSYRIGQEWYRWFIGHCKSSGCAYVSYRDAVAELGRKTAAKAATATQKGDLDNAREY